MKFILITLMAASIASLSYAQEDCADYARSAPAQSDQANLAQAKICSKTLVESLKASVKKMDQSTAIAIAPLKAPRKPYETQKRSSRRPTKPRMGGPSGQGQSKVPGERFGSCLCHDRQS